MVIFYSYVSLPEGKQIQQNVDMSFWRFSKNPVTI